MSIVRDGTGDRPAEDGRLYLRAKARQRGVLSTDKYITYSVELHNTLANTLFAMRVRAEGDGKAGDLCDKHKYITYFLKGRKENFA